MPVISKIEVQKNNESRANLYLDDKFYAGISIELCIKNHLKKGMEIEKSELDEMILEDEKGSALSKAIKYMGSALKTSKQIRDYLNKKEYNRQTIDYVLEKMIEYKYLDDEAYARSFILTYSNKYGKLKLIQALKSKGVSDKIIDQVFDENLELNNNIENIAKKYLKNKEITNETYLKLSRFLYSRGYEFEEINRVVNKLKGENLC